MVDHILSGQGYFYQVKTPSEADINTDEAKEVRTCILEGIKAQVRKESANYFLFDDAVGREEPIPAEVKYVFLPSGADIYGLLEDKKQEIDGFFEDHPEITLVISFEDGVEKQKAHTAVLWQLFSVFLLQEEMSQKLGLDSFVVRRSLPLLILGD